MSRAKHTEKEVEAALLFAERQGWRIKYPAAHWGVLLCPEATRDGCKISVSGTPRNAGHEARRITMVRRCPHGSSTL